MNNKSQIAGKLYVVIPAFNEEKRLPQTISKIRQYLPLTRIIVVDDGSRQPISDFLPRSVIVARHKVNLGKGMALKTGCELGLKLGAKYILLMDADGQHDPKEIPVFINQLKQSQIVFGCRTLAKNMPIWRFFGNRFLNYSVSTLFNLKLRDVWCGYRAFDVKIYPKIKWESCDYSSDVELVVNVGRHKFSYSEIVVGTIYHDKGSVTGTTLQDGLKLIIDLFIWKLKFT